jgi:hypothetical protein
MAVPLPRGNLRGPLFPRLLLGLSVKMNLDGEQLANQLLIRGLNGDRLKRSVPADVTLRLINPAAAD